MGFLRRPKVPEADETTQQLLRRGVYAVEVRAHDGELRRIGSHAPYSFWSAVRYIFILSVVLWWLPNLGQMIAGYVGGRRAGSPWRGVAAALLPAVVLYGFLYATDHGLVTGQAAAIVELPAVAGQLISGAIPVAQPYIEFVSQYFAVFADAMRSTMTMGVNGYFVVVIFAYIGGIVADQGRREASVRQRSMGLTFAAPAPVPREEPEDVPRRLEQWRRIPEGGTTARARARSRVVEEELPAPAASLREDPRYARDVLNHRLVERSMKRWQNPRPPK